MTSSADVSSCLIAAAQTLLETRLAVAPRPARIRLRSSMVHLPDQDLHQQIRLPLKGKAALGVVHGLNLRHPNFRSLGSCTRQSRDARDSIAHGEQVRT